MDLLGFGLGDMPAPGTADSEGVPVEYSIVYWSEQLLRFCSDVVRRGRETDHTSGAPSPPPLFLVANSIGSMVTMQAAVRDPELCRGLVFIGPSMRQLHVRKRSWLQSITAPIAMRVLSYRPLGAYFLKSVARPDQLRRVLLMAYAVPDAVDDELVQLLREPALLPGALGVFLAFITYDTGPVPEDLMPLLSCPSVVIWGELDKFEPYKEGRALRHYATVEQFISLPGVGHCAHDEEPELVNQIVADFIASHTTEYVVADVDNEY
jgi:pimeloyl-ACP methyl ester carboxylesterase